MLVELHPPELTGGNLRELIAGYAARACPDLEVTVSGVVERPVPRQTSAFLYRCARECLTNVTKHAAARQVDVILAGGPDEVRLLVRDDGIGIPAGVIGAGEGHLGLLLLQEAACDLGGSLHADGTPAGTTITITLPT
jgi:two-component system NarL family sensor kinase